ncbi:MAG: ribosome-associated translation inhibitor RaiA [Kiritimatiellales bacterium]|nr:ribosome-associated translation inhibitor RaiA [Kiritimatiellales bacterium]
MNIQHFEKGFEFSDAQRLLMASKVGKLATYCKKVKDDSSVIRIEANNRSTKKGNDQMKVTVTVELPKKILRAESRRVDPLIAVDRCVEKLEPQIKKYKDKSLKRALGKMPK